MAPDATDTVSLTDLEVIQRWSLAVRQASADRGELVTALRNDLAWLEGGSRATEDEAERPAARRATRSAGTAKRTTTSTRTTRRKA